MISIVIPLYNKEKAIVGTLDSVLAQTYTDYEILVVDDGSTDESRGVVEKYIIIHQSAPITLIRKENGGVCSARNKGIREAKGEYIALLDADDLWDKEYLAEQVKMIRDFPNAVMWGINFAEMSNGKLVRELATGLPKGFRGYVEHYFQMPGRVSDLFCSSSVVIRKEVFSKVGGFDERIKYSEDNDMWWRIVATCPVAFFDKYMCFYRFDAENRALHRKIWLKYDLPFFVDKYRKSIFCQNKVFYTYINRYSAQWIARYYFETRDQINDAKNASKKLDYSVISPKYRLLFGLPYFIAKWLYYKIQRHKS